MSFEKDQVKRFYEIIWNQQDKSAIPEILHEAFLFHGSLGQDTRGHEGFIEYLETVHHALGEYRCDIIEMIGEPSRVFARMRFSGIHRNSLLGHPPTSRKVSWEGAALFHFQNRKISDVWVVGDLDSLKQQLSRK